MPKTTTDPRSRAPAEMEERGALEDLRALVRAAEEVGADVVRLHAGPEEEPLHWVTLTALPDLRQTARDAALGRALRHALVDAFRSEEGPPPDLLAAVLRSLPNGREARGG